MKSDINSLRSKFGSILTEMREDRKMTQKDLADILHVSIGTVAHYEQGRSMPPAETLVKISEFFEVPIDYLLCKCQCKVEYGRLSENCTDNYSYGKIINQMYNLSAKDKQFICYLLELMSK